MTFATISKAARVLGYKSRSTLYTKIDRGELDEFLCPNLRGRRFLKLEGLREYLIATTVPRANGNVLSR